MKNKWKLLLVAVIAIALVAVVVLLLGTTRTSYAANGESGVLFSDYFSSNAAKPDWKVGFNETLVSPGTVADSLQLSGSGLVPCAAMLDKALPNQFDLFFTMDTKERGGDSRDPGVFFCVDGDYNQRYQLLISDKKLVLRYNGTQEVAVKKVDELVSGRAHAIRVSVHGAKLQVYVNGAKEPNLKFNAGGDFESFMEARHFGVISYAREAYFDNLVITNGKDYIPVEELSISGTDNQKTIKGIGNSLQMQVFVNPSNASDRAFLWTVDDGQIATVTQDGLLTATGYGTVTVTAQTRDDTGISASCKVKVTVGEKEAPVMSTNRPKVLSQEGVAALTGQEPGLCVLNSGRILLSAQGQVASSDDGGKTWSVVLTEDIQSGRLFQVGDTVYLMGEDGKNSNLVIFESRDAGNSWSTKHVLDTRKWHSAPSAVLQQNGCVYMTMEVQSASAVSAGFSGNAALAPILLKASVGSDLTKRESWTFSSELAYGDILKHGAANAFDYVDVPNSYGDQKKVGWAAGNVFQVHDHTSSWYDPDMKTFYIYLHGSEGVQGYALLLKVTENARGELSPSLVTAPKSNKILFFVPMSGGNDRFSIIYDPVTKLYWQASSYMNRDERIGLYFSRNAYDWCFAGFAAKAQDGTCKSPSLTTDGNDLLVAAQSGDDQVIVYRVEDYAKLVY